MKPVVLQAEAYADLRDAIAWYERKQDGLGFALLETVREALARIREHPDAFQAVHKKVRRTLLRRFPYAIYYLEQHDRIIVIGVLHGHRHPNVWRTRIQ